MPKYIDIKSGRANLALTVFVPWDCTKNCSFLYDKVAVQERACIDSKDQESNEECTV